MAREDPRLPAYPRRDGVSGLRIWCSWCDRWHYHSNEFGYRAAHCHDEESPYVDGYVLTDPAVIEREALSHE